MERLRVVVGSDLQEMVELVLPLLLPLVMLH